MTQIQVYKKNVSLAEKKAHIQQQASMQSNDIDLENLDALEAFIDKFVDMCNNKAKLVCKYSPEELRKYLIKYIAKQRIEIIVYDKIVSKKDFPSIDDIVKNFDSILLNLAKDPMYKFDCLHKTKFDKYDLIDFDNLHILTDASLDNFTTQEYSNINDIITICNKLFKMTNSAKLDNNETKYNMLKSIYANSTYHKLEEFKERVAERKGDVIEWKCGWVKEMDYAVFLKLYKTLYKEFNLNTMESLVKQTTINMKCLEENLRYIVMFACGKNV